MKFHTIRNIVGAPSTDSLIRRMFISQVMVIVSVIVISKVRCMQAVISCKNKLLFQ